MKNEEPSFASLFHARNRVCVGARSTYTRATTARLSFPRTPVVLNARISCHQMTSAAAARSLGCPSKVSHFTLPHSGLTVSSHGWNPERPKMSWQKCPGYPPHNLGSFVPAAWMHQVGGFGQISGAVGRAVAALRAGHALDLRWMLGWPGQRSPSCPPGPSASGALRTSSREGESG